MPNTGGLIQAPDGYDSVEGVGMYMVYANVQAYPTFLVTYKI